MPQTDYREAYSFITELPRNNFVDLVGPFGATTSTESKKYSSAEGVFAFSEDQANVLKHIWSEYRPLFDRSNAEQVVLANINQLEHALSSFGILMQRCFSSCNCCLSLIYLESTQLFAAEKLTLGTRTLQRNRIPRFGKTFIEEFERVFPFLADGEVPTPKFDRYGVKNRQRSLQKEKGWGEFKKAPEAKPVSYGRGVFSEFLESKREQLAKDSTNIINLMTIAPHGTLSSRRWGIEVECVAAQGVDRPAGWDRKYDGSLSGVSYNPNDDEEVQLFVIEPSDCPTRNHSESYRERYPYYWVDPTDCDECGEREMTPSQYQAFMDGRDPDDEDGAQEFVSPILSSYHSRGLEKLLDEIALRPSNDTPGIHVHVDAAGLNAKQVGAVVFSYGILERYLEPLYKRQEREYCREWDSYEINDALLSAKTATQKEYVSYPTRYSTVNLQALEDHGTIEFRAMGPVYADMDGKQSYEYLVRWASFVRELVNLAQRGVPMKEWNRVQNAQDIIKLFVKYGKEYNGALEASNDSEQ